MSKYVKNYVNGASPVKRLAFTSLTIGLLLGYCAASHGQSCYSQAYGQPQAYAEPFALSAQTQTYTVQVPVTVSVQAQPVAVAQPSCQSYAAPVAAPSCGAYGYAAPLAVPFVAAVPSYGFSYGHSFGVNRGFVGHGHSFYGQSFGGVQRFGAIGGTGVSVSARDRRGNQVIANGVNNVRIQRGLFGRINGATADQPRGGLRGLLPF